MQEKEKELQVSEVDYGKNISGSFARYDRDTSSWRTSQACFLEGWALFSETWPRAGMMRNGVVFRRQTWVRRTRETGCGLLPTPVASDATTGDIIGENDSFYMTKTGMPPKSPEALHKEMTEARPGRSKPANLRDQVSNMKMWPTPKCADVFTDKLKSSQQKEGSMHSVNLRQAVKMWPTPTACDHKGAGPTNIRKDGKDRSNDRLDYATYSPDGGKLNPQWVGYFMMGLPLDWEKVEE